MKENKRRRKSFFYWKQLLKRTILFAWRWENDSSKVDWKTIHTRSHTHIYTQHSNETRSFRQKNIRKHDLRSNFYSNNFGWFFCTFYVAFTWVKKNEILPLVPNPHIPSYISCSTSLTVEQHYSHSQRHEQEQQQQQTEKKFENWFHCAIHLKMVWQGLFSFKMQTSLLLYSNSILFEKYLTIFHISNGSSSTYIQHVWMTARHAKNSHPPCAQENAEERERKIQEWNAL